MRRIVIVGGIWVALFAATVGGNLLYVSGRAAASGVEQDGASLRNMFDELSRQVAQLELEAKPRKHSTGSLPDEELDTALHDAIQESQDQLRGCVAGVLPRIKRANEYFEFSFTLKKDDSVDKFGMDELSFERTSFALTAEEETCMLDVFRKLRFAAVSPSLGRVFYEICFNRPSSQVKSG